ncbi:hypothetical protein BC941DRAFT_140726 [Chlamydoabsidia padenii]|nr:hypothetical protein BC941DRAFT_140726 [Chlamydoabsidia padenii]
MIPERFRNRAFVQVIQAFLMVDWIVISVISLGTYFISVLKPHYQEFSLADPDLMYTHVSRDAIPFWLLSVLCFLVPAILITLTALMNAPVVDLNRGLLGLGLSVSFCAMIIESLKVKQQEKG